MVISTVESGSMEGVRNDNAFLSHVETISKPQNKATTAFEYNRIHTLILISRSNDFPPVTKCMNAQLKQLFSINLGTHGVVHVKYT